MRLVATSEAGDGMVLARGVPSGRRDGAPLLRAGTQLTRELASRIADNGCWSVWVADELSQGIEPGPEFPPDVIGLALDAAERALSAAPAAIAAGRPLDERHLRELHSAAGDLAEAVLEHPHGHCPVPDLTVGRASPSWHAVRVALLGTFIGRRALTASGWTDHQGTQRFDRLDSRLQALALGLLAHDLGVSARGIEHTEASEAEQHPAHVSDGAGLLPAESTPAAARAIITQHHERWDGMGYPQRKRQGEIAQGARIAAIADYFDALTARGARSEPASIAAAVAAIEDGAGTRFDPSLVLHFVGLVPPYPVGHPLTLGDGRAAVVAALRSDGRYRPAVKLEDTPGQIVELVADMRPERTRAAA